MELPAATGAGHEALRALQHHEDEQHSVDEQLEVLELLEQARLLWPAQHADQDERPDHHSGDVAHATDDHHHEDDDRDQDHEACREDGADLGSQHRPAEGSQHCAHHEGHQLGAHRVDAHGLGHLLVLPDGHPGPAQAGGLQAPRDVDGDDAEEQHQVEHRPWVGALHRGEAQVDTRDVGDSLGATEIGAQPVRHEQQADYLTESEGHDGQVVAAHPDDGRPDQQADDGGEDDNEDEGESEVQFRGEERAVGRCQDGGRVTAHGEEGHVAEVQEACQADHDIEAQGQQQEEADVGQQLVHDLAQEHRQHDAEHRHHGEQDHGCLLALGALHVPVAVGYRLYTAAGEHRNDGNDSADHDGRGEGQAALLGVHEVGQPVEAEAL